jgi:UDP-4-amino-4,6-dideoxy-N-acetyl-beta-L-altrosamine N-acetyltransferase
MNRLRDIGPGDKEKILCWRNSPEISRYMYADHKITEEEHAKWFRHIFDDRTCKYWIIECDGEDVGLVNIYDLDKHNKRCYWAFYIASPNLRGKGVGSFIEYSVLKYVFGELGLNKLCCEVLGFNEKVVAMHKKFGFQEEGFFRQHRWKDGEANDVVCLALLHEDWQSIELAIEERLKEKGII